MSFFTLTVLATFLTLASGASALTSSKCYALDKENYLYDFTDKVGRELELEGEGSDFVLRFCVDAQNRSNKGYVNFGRFSPHSMLKNEMYDADFIQEYKNGDLMLCEHLANDLRGRVAEVKVICGTCPNGVTCKDAFGCICNVTYTHNLCKAKVLAALDCGKQGSRIFTELSIGLQPKGDEVVKNGITQSGYRKSFQTYSSFESSQKSVSLYATSTAGSQGKLGNPDIQVQPSEGLWVSVVNRPAVGIISVTEATMLLKVDWKCEKTREQIYEVNIRIPIEGYDHVDFSLHIQCRALDTENGVERPSVKVLAVLSLIVLAGIILLGITYIYRLNGQYKSDDAHALPLIDENHNQVDEREDAFQAAIEVPLL